MKFLRFFRLPLASLFIFSMVGIAADEPDPGQVLISVGRLLERGHFSGQKLDDKVSARLSLLKHRQAPTYKATDGGSLGEETTHSVTGTLYITPSDNFSIRLRGSYQKDSDGPATWAYLRGSQYGGTSVHPPARSSRTGAAARKIPLTEQPASRAPWAAPP